MKLKLTFYLSFIRLCGLSVLAAVCTTAPIALSLAADSEQLSAGAAAQPPLTLSAEDESILIGLTALQDMVKESERLPRITSLVPDENGGIQRTGVTEEFKTLLKNTDDYSPVLNVMQTWKLEFKGVLSQDSVFMGVREEYTPEYLLFRAATYNHLELAKKILANSHADVNAMQSFYPVDERTALLVATKNQLPQMVELLLAAGADPKIVSSKQANNLSQALENGDARSTELLLNAGLTKISGPRYDRRFDELVRNNNVDIVRMLVDKGMQPDLTKTSYQGSTALVSALLRGHEQMALVLLPYSDARIATKSQHPRVDSSPYPMQLLPPTNALFLARLVESDQSKATEQAILDRIEQLGGQAAVQLSQLQAADSASGLAYSEEDVVRAFEILDQYIAQLDLASILTADDNHLTNALKRVLVKKHELDIITNKPSSPVEQSMMASLATFGEPTEHWHDMMVVMQSSEAGDDDNVFYDWLSKHEGMDTMPWDYTRLNNWIHAKSDNQLQKRMFTALDFFEFGLSTAK